MSNEQVDDGKFNCITNLEKVAMDTLIRQYETEMGEKVEICEKCRPTVENLIFYFFWKMVNGMLEEKNPELSKSLKKKEE